MFVTAEAHTHSLGEITEMSRTTHTKRTRHGRGNDNTAPEQAHNASENNASEHCPTWSFQWNRLKCRSAEWSSSCGSCSSSNEHADSSWERGSTRSYDRDQCLTKKKSLISSPSVFCVRLQCVRNSIDTERLLSRSSLTFHKELPYDSQSVIFIAPNGTACVTIVDILYGPSSSNHVFFLPFLLRQ